MNRFVLEDKDIIILEPEKQTNGGPGSGNWGEDFDKRYDKLREKNG